MFLRGGGGRMGEDGRRVDRHDQYMIDKCAQNHRETLNFYS